MNHFLQTEKLYLVICLILNEKMPFLQAVNYLLKKDDEQLTIHDLITKMGQLCENPFSFKHMKRRLLDYFGESYNY